ncbi:hypothetical protein [Helcococcus sueciensis]|uniref:hypothetical protein n=1 Tax=Helcococcus sueciensis TaxID=241555 RepID=UPI0003FEF22A|nr:hypothetical protein [Helcococcus sueciensis]
MSFEIDKIHEMLNEIVDSIDETLFEGLNGGVVLEEKIKFHEESINEDLIILGEYQRHGFIKRIIIYYGSLIRRYSHYNDEQMYNRLEELVNHELRHHVEYKAKLRDLVDEDEVYLENYKMKRNKK